MFFHALKENALAYEHHYFEYRAPFQSVLEYLQQNLALGLQSAVLCVGGAGIGGLFTTTAFLSP